MKIRIGSTRVSPHRFIILEFLQDRKLVAAHGFGAVVGALAEREGDAE